jgi:hypothetical protein
MPKSNEYPSSEFQREKNSKKLKKQKTKKQLNLV